jgi:cell division transport system ATP-binding protein
MWWRTKNSSRGIVQGSAREGPPPGVILFQTFCRHFFCREKGFLGNCDELSTYLFCIFSCFFDYPCRIGGQRCLMIEIHHLYKQYGNDVYVLEDINLVIDRGEFVFIVGPSGAGKSTLLKLLLREFLPTRGFIKIFGRDITRLRKREIPLLRRNIGMVFQDFRLLEDRNVFENVAFSLRVTGVSSREINKRVPLTLELVGLQDKALKNPGELSGGEQQRVCVARAIVNRPAVVLADEPTGNLDPATSMEIMKLLHDINIRGTTVVVATHAKELVDYFQKRVVVLEGSRVVSDRERGVYFNAY